MFKILYQKLKEVKINEELAYLIEIYFIELPRFKEDVKFPGEIESNVVRKLELEDKAIKKAKDELYRLSLDDKERERYRDSSKYNKK